MFPADLAATIDAVTPPGLTHIGIVLKNSADAVLITEPQGHPYGVSATLNKVKLMPGEAPSEALARCLRELVGVEPSGLYPIPTAWATNNSRGFYFAGLFDGEPTPGPNRVAWMLPEEARQRIGASKGADSRQRDLGLLAAASDLFLSPFRRILLMVRELHLMGFEQLRAAPYMYPIAWRCPVIPAAWTWREHGAQFDSYFSGMPHEYADGQDGGTPTPAATGRDRSAGPTPTSPRPVNWPSASCGSCREWLGPAGGRTRHTWPGTSRCWRSLLNVN